MINVTVYHDDKGRILGFTSRGHAGQAAPGQDIVCAGVSAITFTACNGLEHFLGEKNLRVEAPHLGELSCFLQPALEESQQRDAQVILKTMEIGLKDVEKSYGAFLRVEKRRCIPC